MYDNISLLFQIILHAPSPNAEHPIFTVDDGAQPPVTVMCKERNILVATFSRLLLTRIGQYSYYRQFAQAKSIRPMSICHSEKKEQAWKDSDCTCGIQG